MELRSIGPPPPENPRFTGADRGRRAVEYGYCGLANGFLFHFPAHTGPELVLFFFGAALLSAPPWAPLVLRGAVSVPPCKRRGEKPRPPRRRMWTEAVFSDLPMGGSANRGSRAAKPLAPEGLSHASVYSSPVSRGSLGGSPSSFGPAPTGGLPPECVFAC